MPSHQISKVELFTFQSEQNGALSHHSFAWEVNKHAAVDWTAPGLQQLMVGNLIRTDDPTRTTWWLRKAVMVPGDQFASVPFTYNGPVRWWNMGHQTGGGVGYTSGFATSALALDIYSTHGVHFAQYGYAEVDGNGIAHTKPYFERNLQGGGTYDPSIDWYHTASQRYYTFDFDYDTWYFFEVECQIYSDGSGYWHEKINGSTWFHDDAHPLHYPGVSTTYYPNNAGQTGFETIEGAYEAAGSDASEQHFVCYQTQSQVAKSQAACIADVPTTSFGDHSIPIPGSGVSQSSYILLTTGLTLDDSGWGGGTGSNAPLCTTAPSISGTPQVGQHLIGSQGVWTGTPTPTLTQEWESSPDGNDPWTGTGDTDLDHLLVSGDLGLRFRLRVSGTNTAGGPITAYSPKTAAVVATSGSGGSGGRFIGHKKTSVATPRIFTPDHKTSNEYFNGTVVRLDGFTMTIEGSGGAGSQVGRAWIYYSTGNLDPNGLLIVSNEITVNGNDLVADIDISVASNPILPVGYYTIGFSAAPPSGADNIIVAYFDDAVGQLIFDTDTYADGEANPFGTINHGDGIMSIWANVTPQHFGLTSTGSVIVGYDGGSVSFASLEAAANDAARAALIEAVNPSKHYTVHRYGTNLYTFHERDLNLSAPSGSWWLS